MNVTRWQGNWLLSYLNTESDVKTELYLIGPSKEILVLLFGLAVGMCSLILFVLRVGWDDRCCPSVCALRSRSQETGSCFSPLKLCWRTYKSTKATTYSDSSKPPVTLTPRVEASERAVIPRPSVVALLFFMLITQCVAGFSCFWILRAQMWLTGPMQPQGPDGPLLTRHTNGWWDFSRIPCSSFLGEIFYSRSEGRRLMVRLYYFQHKLAPSCTLSACSIHTHRNRAWLNTNFFVIFHFLNLHNTTGANQ